MLAYPVSELYGAGQYCYCTAVKCVEIPGWFICLSHSYYMQVRYLFCEGGKYMHKCEILQVKES